MADPTRPRRELPAFDRADRWGVMGLLVVVSAATLRERAAMRLWLLAIVLAVGLPVAWFARSTVDLVLLTEMDLGGAGPGIVLSLPWVPVLAGTVLALVATAFRSGERLREDVEGLI